MSEQKRISRPGKKGGIKRRHFIAALIVVCSVAVIAEAVLLVHFFTKKKPSEKPEKTVSGTPVPTIPVKDPETAKRYVITKEYGWRYNEAIGRSGEFCKEYEYDESGRVTVIRVLDGDKVISTAITTYGKEGSVTETWEPDRNGTLEKRSFADQTGETFRTVYQDELDSCYAEYDGEKNRTALKYVTDGGEVFYTRWEYDENGNMIKRSESEPDNGAERVSSYHTFDYDDEGRIVKDTCYAISADGQVETDWWTEFMYDGTKKTERFCYYDSGILRSEEWTYDGNIEERYQIEYEGEFTYTYLYYFPEANYPDHIFYPYEDCFCSREWKEAGMSDIRQTVEFNEQGQAVRFYSVEGDKKTLVAECEYDENGRFRKVVTHYFWENMYVDAASTAAEDLYNEEVLEWTFTYDDAGNLTQLTREDMDTHSVLVENYEWIAIPVLKY